MGCGQGGRVREGWGSAVRTVYALGMRMGGATSKCLH